jgi:LysR family cyn operon transcriptional activator
LLNRSFEMRKQIDEAFARADLPLDVRVEAASTDSLMLLAESGSFATIASTLLCTSRKGWPFGGSRMRI